MGRGGTRIGPLAGRAGRAPSRRPPECRGSSPAGNDRAGRSTGWGPGRSQGATRESAAAANGGRSRPGAPHFQQDVVVTRAGRSREPCGFPETGRAARRSRQSPTETGPRAGAEIRWPGVFRGCGGRGHRTSARSPTAATQAARYTCAPRPIDGAGGRGGQRGAPPTAAGGMPPANAARGGSPRPRSGRAPWPPSPTGTGSGASASPRGSGRRARPRPRATGRAREEPR